MLRLPPLPPRAPTEPSPSTRPGFLVRASAALLGEEQPTPARALGLRRPAFFSDAAVVELCRLRQGAAPRFKQRDST